MNPKTLIFILGPQAVGKMTVGQELSRVTGYKFMHNHQTIEMLLSIFDYGTPSFKRLLLEFRRSIFEEVAANETIMGFIFSYAWDFDAVLDRMDIECYSEPFLRRGGRVLFVELAATLETRLERNRGELRQQHKPSKRDADFAETLLLAGENYRCNSNGDFPYPERHLQIRNDGFSPQDVTAQIVAHFELPTTTNAENSSR
ncbi:MAG TPA: AAA family ATPase [Abditibacterium sp.]|jgi:hypothetical protein